MFTLRWTSAGRSTSSETPASSIDVFASHSFWSDERTFR